MLLELLHPLPVRIAATDDEAGLSFLFRTLCANGLSLRDGLHWLELKSWNCLRTHDAQTLAWITSAEPVWLSQRIVTVQRRKSPRALGFMGHVFGSGAADFSRSAKLCWQCIKRKKYHRVSWQLRCISCCTEHGAILSDRCPHCDQLIRWNRPAVDICSCGGFLTIASAIEPLSEHVTNWVNWIENRLLFPSGFMPAAHNGLPAFFDSLSIDGAFRVVVAVGLHAEADCAMAKSSALAATSRGMTHIVRRGIERLHCLGNNLADIYSLRTLVHLPILERMRVSGVSVADQNCASVLIDYLRGPSRPALDPRGLYVRGQLSLFP